MNRLNVSLIRRGCAQGKYRVRAKGSILAVLRWGNRDGALEEWGPFAYVPVDPAGNGEFFFPSERGIPEAATHVWAQLFSGDFSIREAVSAEIPEKYRPVRESKEDAVRFSVLTDLHLAVKPWNIRQALRMTESNTILLLGDSTNDGLPEQFEQFRACVETAVPEKTVLPVIGNHDVARDSTRDGCAGYAAFQRDLLVRAENKGMPVTFAPDGRAYSIQIGGMDVIGLQCVTEKRLFRFPEGAEIDWLEEHLSTVQASRHIILCHAPLLLHNPARNSGTPYLNLDRRIQEIADRNGQILFLSGHTHSSPNVLKGNAEYDRQKNNLYLDCGSVVATDTSDEKGMMHPDWKDGCKTELTVTKHEIEICMCSIKNGIKFPRGYYRFRQEEADGENV